MVAGSMAEGRDSVNFSWLLLLEALVWDRFQLVEVDHRCEKMNLVLEASPVLS